jgi:uncharacterized protein YukJ
MNQGSRSGAHDSENGRHTDGALFLHFRNQDRWYGVYLAFDTQTWKNDGRGYPDSDAPALKNQGIGNRD